MDRMSELTKKLHILKTGGTEETVSLYSSLSDLSDPTLKLQVDGSTVYAQLGSITDSNATSLRVYRNSDSSTYSVLNGIVEKDDYIAYIERTIKSYSNDEITSIGNGAFYGCTSLTSIDLPNVTSIDNNAFYNCTSLTSIDLPNVTSIGGYAFNGCSKLSSITNLDKVESIGNYAFDSCTSLTSIDLPNVTSIGNYAFNGCTSLTSIDLPNVTSIDKGAFNYCTSLTSIDLPNVTSIGYNAFFGCTSLTSIDLPNVTSIDNNAFNSCTSLTFIDLPNVTSIGNGAFYNCTSLTSIDLPNVTSIGGYAFYYCNKLTAIHFSAANKSKITANSYYSDKWGATNATIYFDINAAKLYFSNFDTDATYSINGEVLTGNNGYILIPDEVYTLIITKSGYLPYFESISTSGTDDITKDIALTPDTDAASRTDCTLNITYPTTDTAPSISTSFYYNGYLFQTVEGTNPSIAVLRNAEITYKVKADGYKSVSGTITASQATVSVDITLEVQTYVTYDLSYPFTDDAGVLANLVDDNNFTIAETPTVNSGSGIASSIINGAKSFKVNSSQSYGYIKFHTPNTEDTDLLTVSVTCNAYAESSYDVGAVFIDTSVHQVTTNYRFTGGSGKTDSTYGYVLYSSYGKSSSAYATYTYTLQPDTDYYLQFAYTKDSSGNSNWDRFSITNIKFTDEGTY